MLYDYLCENYTKGEPIFISELSGYSKDYIRQEMKRLTDTNKINRLSNGVYYLPYLTILGTPGRLSVDKYVEKKYLKNNNGIIGYYTGLQLANMYGFTTQNPAYTEIRTNNATTLQRKLNIDGRKIIIYKSLTEINESNLSSLMFLDLLTDIDKYCELNNDDFKRKLKEFTKKIRVNYNQVKQYINFYPSKVFKNIYNGGLMYELVR